MKMTVDQALDAAEAGGFTFNHGLIVITCVGWAESRFVTDARNTNPNGSIDRGWLQINSVHTDISDAECDDPATAAAYAWDHISNHGASFSAWVAYTSGAYKGADNTVWTMVSKARLARQLQSDLNAAQATINGLQDNNIALAGALAQCSVQKNNLANKISGAIGLLQS